MQTRSSLVAAVIAALVASVAAACSAPEITPRPSPSPGSGEAGARTTAGDAGSDAPPENATIVEGAFTARSAAFTVAATLDGHPLVDVVLADVADACTTTRVDRFTKALHLTIQGTGTAALTPGVYPIVTDNLLGGYGPPPEATAILWTIYDDADKTCALSNDGAAAAGGTITITSVAPSNIDGRIDLTLAGDAGVVTGTFVASSCESAARDTYACPLARP